MAQTQDIMDGEVDVTDTTSHTIIDINQHQLQFRTQIQPNNLKHLYLHKDQFSLQIPVTIILHNLQIRATIHAVMVEDAGAGKIPSFSFF